MRATRFLRRVAAASFAIGILAARPAYADRRGEILPLISAPDLEGRPINLADVVARRRVALFFWDWRRATSTRAMQVLDRLAEVYGDEGLTVVAIEGEGASVEQVRERVEKLRAIGVRQRYTIVPDPGGPIGRRLGLVGTPQVLLVDGAGRVFAHFETLRADDDQELERNVRELLRIDNPVTPPAQTRPQAAGVQAPGPAGRAASSAPSAPAQPGDPNQALLERWRYLGGYHLNRGEYPKAEEYFRRYVELAPREVHGWLRLGEACARQGRRDAAREAWERVLKMEPGNAEADAKIRALVRGEE
jgi:tetratricopeptide (TPR) repeat protein